MQILDKTLPIPLIQGGMGVGVSMGGLAGAVAACGAMGTISTADIGFREPDFCQHPEQANLRALTKEIRRAKEIANGHGLVAVNAMVATRQYADAVKAAVAAGADVIVSGAGLPLDLPELAAGANVALAPVVSGGRAAGLICKTWARHYQKVPDFVVLEGPLAGGHLGFSYEILTGETQPSLDVLLQEVLAALRPYEQTFGRAIPVFVAGGVANGQEMAHYMKLGAAGVQVATQFIATEECDASQAYKDILIQAGPQDLRIIHSPVGMPSRALYTPLVERLLNGTSLPIQRCYGCIKTCNPATTTFCITRALIAAVQGNYQDGLFFCSGRIELLQKMGTVPELIHTFTKDWSDSL